MNQLNNKNDMVSFNLYCRSRLKKSLTYSICNGNFKNVRILLESIGDTNSEQIDVNEKDEWWNPDPAWRNGFRQKSAASRPISIYNNSTDVDDLKIILPLVRHKTTVTTLHKRGVGRTSLMLCSLIEDKQWAYTIMQNLIEKGANIQLVDSNGHNALMYACLYNRSTLLALLLNASGDSNLYNKDTFGNTVFHLASLSPTDQNCMILNETFMKYQTDTTNKMIRNNLGHTPYDICQINGHENCIKYLYPGVNDSRRVSFYCAPSTRCIRLDSLIDDQFPEPDVSKLPKKSNVSLFATLLSIDDSNLVNSNYPKKREPYNPLTSRISIQDYYKPLFSLREPMIKKNNLYFEKDILEPQKSLINLSKSARRKENNDIQLVTYRLIESTSKFNNSSINFDSERFNNKPESTKSTASSTTLESNWKSNMKKILDVLESTKSKSFRASNKNLSTNLFDQIANGILIKMTNTNAESPSRRNSIFRKQSSAMSNSQVPLNDQGRRQSITSSLGKGSKSQSRRASITVL